MGSLNPSQAFSQSWQAQSPHERVTASFPFSYRVRASSTLGTPSELSYNGSSQAHCTLSLEKRSWEAYATRASFEKESSYVHAELYLPWNPLQHLKRQLPKSKCQLAASKSSLWSHPTCTVSYNTASDTPLKRPEDLRPSPGVRKGWSQKEGQKESVWKKYKAKLRGRSNRREERNRGTRNKAQDDRGRQEVFLTWAPPNVVSVCENEEQIQRERKHLKK